VGLRIRNFQFNERRFIKMPLPTPEVKTDVKPLQKPQGVPSQTQSKGNVVMGGVAGKPSPQIRDEQAQVVSGQVASRKKERGLVNEVQKDGSLLIFDGEDPLYQNPGTSGVNPLSILSHHAVKIFDRRNDPSQKYPFLTDCTCGFQSRGFSKEQAFDAKDQHLAQVKVIRG
jgi:hypothetical protein